MASSRHKRQRTELFWRQDGKCCYCGDIMILPECLPHGQRASPPPNMATLEHLNDRFSPLRGQVIGPTHACACWQCNHQRGLFRENWHRQRMSEAVGTKSDG